MGADCVAQTPLQQQLGQAYFAGSALPESTMRVKVRTDVRAHPAPWRNLCGCDSAGAPGRTPDAPPMLDRNPRTFLGLRGSWRRRIRSARISLQYFR